MSVRLLIFTASHIECLERIENGLKPMLASVHRLDGFDKHYISLSHDESMQDAVAELIDLFQTYPRLHVTMHDQHKRQFDHFAYLRSKVKPSGSDRVMLMDDDDILVTIPDTKGCFTGQQLIADEKAQYEFGSDPTAIASKCTRIETDLSGFTVTADVLDDYFTEHRSTIASCSVEDCYFMKFVELQQNTTKPIEPFVIHQSTAVPNDKREWIKQNESELSVFSEETKQLQNTTAQLQIEIDDLKRILKQRQTAVKRLRNDIDDFNHKRLRENDNLKL